MVLDRRMAVELGRPKGAADDKSALEVLFPELGEVDFFRSQVVEVQELEAPVATEPVRSEAARKVWPKLWHIGGQNEGEGLGVID